jgi:nucleoprotein TPR
LAAAQSKITSFQQDLAQATARVSEIQQAADADRAAWLSDKRTLEDTIVDMSTSETDTDRAMQETVVRQLEERVKVRYILP